MPECLASPCWTAADARSVLVTEALTGSDALFLATHAPIRGFGVAGTHSSEVLEASEAGLLEALCRRDLEHAFCVVQGEPGSGKSHLIRWLSVNWPEGDIPILVQRADGSLDGTLRQLRARVPDEFRHLFDRLGQQQAAGLVGRSLNFLLTLGASLRADYFDTPMEDADWCGECDPSRLILSNQVRENWRGPRRILELMDGRAEPNSESANFELSDVVDLARHCSGVRDSVASERLARRLVNEAARMRDARDAGRSWDEIRAGAAGSVETSLKLIAALDRRRNHAVQSVIGISADGLKRLFEELRTALAGRARLVLLLEDVTSWQGLDDSLVDALVTDATTRPTRDLCPLISVVGVTSRYFSDLKPNYVQRITHLIGLGESEGRFEDVASLRAPRDRAAFVARYMAASRVGPVALDAWREEFRTVRNLEPPNACVRCPRQEGCHAVFGEVDGVGLFPFSSGAVETFFSALKIDAGGMTHRTPRGLLKGVLAPTLLNVRAFDEARYPGPEVEPAVIERPLLPIVIARRLEIAAPEDDALRQRLRRVMSYWGHLQAVTEVDGNGDRSYAGVKVRLLEAFGLPAVSDASQTAPVAPTPPVAGAAPEPEVSVVPTAPSRPERDVSRRPVRAAPQTPAPAPARPRTATRRELEVVRADIAALREGGRLSNPTALNTAVYDLLRRLDCRRLGLDRWTFDKVFTLGLVKIADTGDTSSRHFVVPRSAWLLSGLEAYAALRTGEDLTEEEHEYSRRLVAVALRRLEALATRHVRDRLSTTADGRTWTPPAAAAQILLTRAWLRGGTTADRPTSEQWEVLLSDEDGPETAPGVRTNTWQELLNATNPHHDDLRTSLREMLSLPQGGATSFGIADASTAAAAMVSFIDDLRAVASPVPRGVVAAADHEEPTKRLASKLAESLPDTPRMERSLLVNRSEALSALLRGRTVKAHLERVDLAVRTAADAFPSVANREVRAWTSAFDRFKRTMEDDGAMLRLEEFMVDVCPDSGVVWGRGASLLSRLAGSPAADLKATLDLAKFGEDAVGALLPHVEDLIREGERGLDLVQVREEGHALREAAGLIGPGDAEMAA